MTKIIKKNINFIKISTSYIIYYMMKSIDDRIDCEKIRKLKGVYEYYKTLDALKHNID